MNDSQRKVFDLLAAAGSRGATTSELVQLGAGDRFGARICELRKDFHCEITTETLRRGSARYTLLSAPRELDGPARPLGPVEGGGPGALGVSGAGTPALFEMPSASTAHWEGEAA